MSANQTQTLKVAVVQMTSSEDVHSNAEFILRSLNEIAAHAVDLILFPENSLFLRVNPGSAVPSISLDNPEILNIQKFVDRKGIAVHLGSIPYDDEGQRRNSTIVFKPQSRPQAIYHKIHLFDVDLVGQKPIRESDVFAHGSQPAIWDYKGFRFGLSICYDLRFSELYQPYARAGVDAILIPAAFTVPTGTAHWHVMLRARAIEAQAYVLAAAQGGEHTDQSGQFTRQTFGHSLAVDPWGRVLLDIDATTGAHWGIVELSKDVLHQVRGQIPMSSHRRL